ncbi:meiosis mei2 [Fusarium mexicanum]|uniref:Meiosis mei2 n=1 Tax=Fusarium mexicanum TaxID=751941 RepID=A0A8H5IIN3_9HYPO|nr:meiosis mei2 [Fusarium mexicanum]
MGKFEKLKFKLRKLKAKLKVRRLLAKDAAKAADTKHETLRLVSLERVICLLEEARALHQEQQEYDAANVKGAAKDAAVQDGGGIWDGATAVASNSLERVRFMDLAVSHRIEVCDTPTPSIVDLGNFITELTQKGVRFHGGRNLETSGERVYVVFEDLRDAAWALVALESQLVRLCEICTVCLGVNGVHVNAYSVELAHSFELRLQRNQDVDGPRTLDTHTHTHTHSLSLSLSLYTAIMGTPGRIGLDLDLDRILGYHTQLNQTLETHLDFYLDTHKLVQLVNTSLKPL